MKRPACWEFVLILGFHCLQGRRQWQGQYSSLCIADLLFSPSLSVLFLSLDLCFVFPLFFSPVSGFSSGFSFSFFSPVFPSFFFLAVWLFRVPQCFFFSPVPWFFFGFSLLSVCPWFRVSPAVAREWPFFTRSCLTIVRHERFCFREKNRGRKLAPLCTVSVLASCCVPGVTSSLEAEKRKRDGGLVG